MKWLEQFKAVCEFLEGARDEAPTGLKWLSAAWVQGIWWGLLAAGILLFSGQTSKFIYIDF